MFSENRVRRGLHSFQIERPPANGNVPRHKRRANPASKNSVLIHLADGTMPRMEILRSMLCGQDAYRSRKNPIQRALKIVCRDGGAQRKACHLSPSVDAGIRPSRSLWQYLLPRNRRNCVRQQALDRRPSRLNLPAVEIRSVVRQNQFPHCSRITTFAFLHRCFLPAAYPRFALTDPLCYREKRPVAGQ